jgi:hypothetical protein
MLTLKLINEAVAKMESRDHETKVVIVTGKGLIDNGMTEFNGETIDAKRNYAVELGNHPYSYKPTSVKAL